MKENDPLFLKPKMGIIPEVSSQNYETIAKQLREPIANSIDANATEVRIILKPDGEYTNLIITDNGDGMNENDFIEQFLALGGSEKFFDEDKIGRIGIGFMACAPLCNIIEIHTRKKGTNIAFVAEIDVLKLFDQAVRIEKIEKFKIGRIKKVYEKANEFNIRKHYTRIVLKELKPLVLEKFNNEKEIKSIIDQLRKILPLKFPVKPKLFNFISTGLSNRLRELANEKSIDVFYNGKKLTKKVFGDNNEDYAYIMEILEESPKNSKTSVTGYLIEPKKRSNEWFGLVSRLQNIAVEDSGYLGYTKKMNVMQKISGELYINGLNKNTAITINRNEFNESDLEYLQIRKYLHESFDRFTSRAYRRSYIAHEINKDIRQKTGIQKNIRKATEIITKIEKKKKPSIKKSTKKKSAKKTTPKKKVSLNLDEIDTKKYGKIKVKPVEKKDESKSRKRYEIKWKGKEGTKATVEIEKSLLQEFDKAIILDGRSFKIYFSEDLGENDPCIIDYEKNQIIFNQSHPIVKKKDDKIITFLYLLTYFSKKVTSIEEYRDKVIDILAELKF